MLEQALCIRFCMHLSVSSLDARIKAWNHQADVNGTFKRRARRISFTCKYQFRAAHRSDIRACPKHLSTLGNKSRHYARLFQRAHFKMFASPLYPHMSLLVVPNVLLQRMKVDPAKPCETANLASFRGVPPGDG